MLMYVHVPFCLRKCAYCAFFSVPHTAELENKYIDALEKEIMVRSGLARGRRVSSIYIGGGTPTLLSLRSLSRIMDRIWVEFSMARDMELTTEANPESVGSKEYAAALEDMGVNRVSLGVQSLDDKMLSVLGRSHTSAQTFEAVRIIRRAGISSLSLDLIWGLPGQSLEGWMADLQTVACLEPEHVSCYGLTLEQGTPLARLVEAKKMDLPHEDIQAAMYVQGACYLESCGILQYEVSNFARPGLECRHNSGYWEGQDYIGLGPSAVSSVNGLRWANPAGILAYAHLSGTSFQSLEAERITRQDFINEKIMLGLRTCRGLGLDEYQGLTGLDLSRRYGHLLKDLSSSGHGHVSKNRLSLTRKGMLVSNEIIERFLV